MVELSKIETGESWLQDLYDVFQTPTFQKLCNLLYHEPGRLVPCSLVLSVQKLVEIGNILKTDCIF